MTFQIDTTGGAGKRSVPKTLLISAPTCRWSEYHTSSRQESKVWDWDERPDQTEATRNIHVIWYFIQLHLT